MDESTGERVRQVVGHHPEQLLRAWLRGDQHADAVDVELLDDPDVEILATTLRECAATGCLPVDEITDVADLVAHVFTAHGRPGVATVRAFGVLAAAVHPRDATGDVPPPVLVPPMVPHTGQPVWGVNRFTGLICPVIGWMTRIEYYAELEDGPSYDQLPVLFPNDSSYAIVEEDGEYRLFSDRALAEEKSSEYAWEWRTKRREIKRAREAAAKVEEA